MTFTPTDPTKAEVRVTGTAPNQELEFYIPRGGKGDPGNPGATGPANSLQIGTVTTSAAGSSAVATITGVAPTQALNLTLPAGPATNFTVLGTATGTSDATPFELRGSGMPNGVRTASVGAYYTDLAGTNGAWRWLKTSGAGNTGWEVMYGDTGWREINTSITATTTSTTLKVKRVGNLVSYFGRLDANGGNVGFTAPTGFLPAWGDSSPLMFESLGSYIAMYTSNRTLFTALKTGSGSLMGNYSTKDAWPTTLPGTAA